MMRGRALAVPPQCECFAGAIQEFEGSTRGIGAVSCEGNDTRPTLSKPTGASGSRPLNLSVVFTYDLDGSEDAETVAFGLDGVSYEIDLRPPNPGPAGMGAGSVHCFGPVGMPREPPAWRGRRGGVAGGPGCGAGRGAGGGPGGVGARADQRRGDETVQGRAPVDRAGAKPCRDRGAATGCRSGRELPCPRRIDGVIPSNAASTLGAEVVASQRNPASIPGWVAPTCVDFLTMVLVEAGEHPASAAARTGWPGPVKQATCTVRRTAWR
jgi:hypothetical protein